MPAMVIALGIAMSGASSGLVAAHASGASSTTALSVANNPTWYGQQVGLSVTVDGPAGMSIPSGDVVFFDGSSELAAVPVDAGGHATFVTTDLAAGDHSLQAVYGGGGGYAGSSSNSVVATIWQASTFTGLHSSRNPSSLGEPVDLFVAVSWNGAHGPSGSVTVYDGSMAVGAAVLDRYGAASLTLRCLAAGDHQLTARYPGDSNIRGSTSPPLRQRVAILPPPGVVVNFPDFVVFNLVHAASCVARGR